MAPRLQLEKAAWRWVETVKPEDITQEHIHLAYRINLAACKRGACRWSRPVTLHLIHQAEKGIQRETTRDLCVQLSAGPSCRFTLVSTN